MPYVNIKITREGNVTPEQKRQLIEGRSEEHTSELQSRE